VLVHPIPVSICATLLDRVPTSDVSYFCILCSHWMPTSRRKFWTDQGCCHAKAVMLDLSFRCAQFLQWWCLDMGIVSKQADKDDSWQWDPRLFVSTYFERFVSMSNFEGNNSLLFIYFRTIVFILSSERDGWWSWVLEKSNFRLWITVSYNFSTEREVACNATLVPDCTKVMPSIYTGTVDFLGLIRKICFTCAGLSCSFVWDKLSCVNINHFVVGIFEQKHDWFADPL